MINKLTLKKSMFALLVSLFASNLYASEAQKYIIDTSHSSVGFSVKHLGISTVRGSFDDFNGEFTYNAKDVSTSSAMAAIKVASINTGNGKRDGHLKECDFFCGEKFGEISFKTTKITPVSDGKFKMSGNLTIRDVTLPIELDATFEGAGRGIDGSNRVGFVATGEIDRTAFGLKWNKLTEAGGFVVSPQVKINIEVQGVEAK